MIVTYRTVPVDELNVFYREAGDPDAPTVLLLREVERPDGTSCNVASNIKGAR
jgi:hypothetical protein